VLVSVTTFSFVPVDISNIHPCGKKKARYNAREKKKDVYIMTSLTNLNRTDLAQVVTQKEPNIDNIFSQTTMGKQREEEKAASASASSASSSASVSSSSLAAATSSSGISRPTKPFGGETTSGETPVHARVIRSDSNKLGGPSTGGPERKEEVHHEEEEGKADPVTAKVDDDRRKGLKESLAAATKAKAKETKTEETVATTTKSPSVGSTGGTRKRRHRVERLGDVATVGRTRRRRGGGASSTRRRASRKKKVGNGSGDNDEDEMTEIFSGGGGPPVDPTWLCNHCGV
jgi:hypothetical protein